MKIKCVTTKFNQTRIGIVPGSKSYESGLKCWNEYKIHKTVHIYLTLALGSFYVTVPSQGWKTIKSCWGRKKSSEWNYTFLRYRVKGLQIGSDSLAGPTGRICQWCETCKWFSSVPATSWPSGRLLSGLEVSQNFLGIFNCQIFIVVIVDLKKESTQVNSMYGSPNCRYWETKIF